MSRTIESMEELFKRVVAEDSRKYDVIASTTSMNIEAGENGAVALTLDKIGGLVEYDLTDHTLGQIAADQKIPKTYFDRMRTDAPELFRTNVEHWFYNQPKPRMVRGLTNDDGPITGRAWMSDKFRRLDNFEIARTLLPEFDALDTTVEFHQAAVTDTRLYVRALFPEIERDVRQVGDTVRWGVEIRNSEIGAGSLTISGFCLKLSCLNGMTTLKALNARHVGKRADEGILSNEALAADDVAFWLAARDTLRHTVSETEFESVVEQLRDAAESTEIVHPVAATKVLANEFQLTEAEQEAVMLSLVKEGDLTRWGALNAVTFVAHEVESFDRQAELEGIGWQIAQLPDAEWQKVAVAA